MHYFTSLPANSGNLLHIQCDDSNDADLSAKFEVACKFIGKWSILMYT